MYGWVEDNRQGRDKDWDKIISKINLTRIIIIIKTLIILILNNNSIIRYINHNTIQVNKMRYWTVFYKDKIGTTRLNLTLLI